MTNNMLFNRLLHLTGCGRNIDNLIYIFSLGKMPVSKSKIRAWRTIGNANNGRGSPMSDHAFNCFLNGLFEYRNQQWDRGVNVFNFPDREKAKALSCPQAEKE